MGIDDAIRQDPRTHPDNANLPNINQAGTIIGVTSAFLSLAFIALSLRLVVRIRDRIWGWDDVFVVIAGTASFLGDVMICIMPQDGLGLHLWTLDGHHLTTYFKHIYTANIAYTASATCVKLSILFQYLRLFAEEAPSKPSGQWRLARRLTWLLIVITSSWGLSFVLLALLACNPIAKNWYPFLSGKCIGWGSKDPDKFFAMFLGHGVSNSVLDILVLLLPVPFLITLRLAGKSRAGLITLFTLGGVVVVMAIARTISLCINRAGTVPVIDMTYYTPIVFLLSVLEVNIAIIAGSIPIFWPAIVTLSANRIFVVNEVEIHVEQLGSDTNDIKLGERNKDKLGVVTTTFDTVSRKHADKLSPRPHRHKSSNASSMGRTLFGPSRSSEESQRNLYQVPSNENRSSRSLTRSDGDDWFLEMNKANSAGQNTTTVQRTQIPFEHIKAEDNR
ncbi:hypothetical protein BDW02DRAFT_613550 [Decorospora gaudefroyi]|uniref:Rhodopsin domain-containing protein n=1 Tax=Decorospora gaudefroyi TaxID=184978 RepID=A0A6A5K3V4_9PLEO|nr:hypothetical protein BDW02DRAFT_613550 [Decorospora gaudefroyi]